MKYKVTSQYARDTERQIAVFDKLDDAKMFVESKINKDAMLKVKVVYRIYKDFDVLEEYDTEKPAGASADTQSAGSQGKGSSASYRPTPFNTAPKPAGMPKKWIVNGDDEDDEKKK